MRNIVTKSIMETWCKKNEFNFNWNARKVNDIPFILAEGDLYIIINSEPIPAFTQHKFEDIVKNYIEISVENRTLA